MNRFSLASLAVSCAALPVLAQQDVPPLLPLLEQAVPAQASASVEARSSAFSALAGLPVDTDSFVAVSSLGELAAQLGAGAAVPGAELAEALDGLALGVSRDAAQDLQRLAPLFELLGNQPGFEESWLAQAEPGAARAIVAQQREHQQRRAANLVELTADFRLFPIYVVLSGQPRAQMLLHQLSLLPLMIPVEPGGPVELSAQGAWRGFCLKGNLLNLDDAGLPPEQESQLKANLENVRVYVMARVLGNRLVLAITSDMNLVKLPAGAADSLLASEKLAAFDSCLSRKAWAVGHTSPALVNLAQQLDRSSYGSVAGFVGGVLRRMGAQNADCARAAEALDSLVAQLKVFTPAARHPEQFMVWQDDAVYLSLVSDARGVEFLPGALSQSAPGHAGDNNILFAESTPLRQTGAPMPELPAVLDNLTALLQGCRTTLRPEYAAGIESHLQHLVQCRPALEKLAAGGQQLGPALAGSTSLLVQEAPAGASHPVCFTLRAGVQADGAAGHEASVLLREGLRALCHGQEVQVQFEERSLLLTSAPGPQGAPEPEKAVAVQGGAVFSLQPVPLSRCLRQAAGAAPAPALQDAADMLEAAASLVERVDGAATTSNDGKLYTLLRLEAAGN